MELTEKEIKVIISMIDSEQFDGAEWTTNGVKLNNLKKKLQVSLKNNVKVLELEKILLSFRNDNFRMYWEAAVKKVEVKLKNYYKKKFKINK